MGLVVIMSGLVLYRFWPLIRGYLGLPPAEDDAAKEAAASAAKLAAGEGAEDPGVSLTAAQSPGATPVRGMHTHMAPGKKGGAAARAQALAQARKALDGDGPEIN